MPLKIGSHVSLTAPEMFLGSAKMALSLDENTFMVYTGAPQNTIRKSIDTYQINETLTYLNENQIDINDVVVHAPYIINLANPDEEKRDFAVRFLTEEVKRTAAMMIPQIVLHPGSAVGKDRKQAIKWIAEGINQVIENTNDANVKIALETMAGKGNEVGVTFEELAEIIKLINHEERISVCLDTCHINDAGYDLVNDLEGVLDHFDQVVGLNKITVIHLNDSKNPLNSRKDRHENIGFGTIGFETLLKIAYYPKFSNIPKILESPYVNDKPPYKLEIKMIKEKRFNPNLKKELE